MLNATEIKGRIKGIEETMQITHAMQLISASKLKKAMRLYENNHKHFVLMRSVIKDIINHSDKIHHPYFERRTGNRVAFLVIAADKGLAGEYNKKVLDLAKNVILNYNERFIFTVGNMANEFFKKYDIHPDIEFLHIAQNPTLEDARQMTFDILDLYDKDMLDEVRIIFTSMQSTTRHMPMDMKILPLEKKDFESVVDMECNECMRDRFDFEPSPQEVVDTLTPQYLIGLIYGALVQASAAEHFERMVAMKAALDNAEEMLKSLKLIAQRVRQEKITTELQEISIAALNNVN